MQKLKDNEQIANDVYNVWWLIWLRWENKENKEKT